MTSFSEGHRKLLLLPCADFIQAGNALPDGFVICESSTQPALVDIELAAADGFVPDHILGLSSRADKENPAAVLDDVEEGGMPLQAFSWFCLSR